MKKNIFKLSLIFFAFCAFQKIETMFHTMSPMIRFDSKHLENFKFDTAHIIEAAEKLSPLMAQGGIVLGLSSVSLYVLGKLAKTRLEDANRGKIMHDSTLALGASLGFAAGLGLICFSSKLAARSL